MYVLTLHVLVYMFLDRAVGYFSFLVYQYLFIFCGRTYPPVLLQPLFLSQYNMYARYTANTHVCVNLFIYCLLQSAQNSPQIRVLIHVVYEGTILFRIVTILKQHAMGLSI